MNLQQMTLKWIDVNHPAAQGQEYVFLRQCVLCAVGENEKVSGFTVFAAQDLTSELLGRLERRRQRPEYAKSRFVLYVPHFLQHRAEDFCTNRPELELKYSSFIKLKHNASGFSLRDRMRVVNVDDSPVLLKFLKHTLDGIGYIDIVEQISDSKRAAERIQELKPDVVTMDIQMPGKTGVDVVKELLATAYFPVLMISSLSLEDGSLVFSALNAGAFDYLQKPKLEDRAHFTEELEKRMIMSIQGQGAHAALRKKKAPAAMATSNLNFADNLLWCLGASTGGTQALTSVFTSLPTHIPPTLVVQHIPAVFSRAFAESLNNLCPFTVKEAEDGDLVSADHVYIAAGGLQMGLEQRQGKLYIRLLDAPPVNRFKPSVDFMFGEVAKLKGLNIVAGVLTGMGKDGAKGLLALRNLGARTFAQDEASSAVYGMPRECFEIGATEVIVPLDTISQTLLTHSQSFRKVS